MNFRPCIDIHNGIVKQIVGSSLRDDNNDALENFVSHYDAEFYAQYYRNHSLKGGHVILLNSSDSNFYELTKKQAINALRAYPGGLQVGGGICPKNAANFLNEGASHVIVTSYAFCNGVVDHKRLEEMRQEVGKERLVLDLSCRKKDGLYYIVTDRWQNYTQEVLNEESLTYFSKFCDEFLIHAVDVEGKAEGIETQLIQILSEVNGINITYAGGVHTLQDIEELYRVGKGRIDVTIGSALDLFGGKLSFEEVIDFISRTKVCFTHSRAYNS